MNKEELIKQHLEKPFEIGDYITVKAKYTVSESVIEGKGKNKKTVFVDKEHIFDSKGTIKEIDNDYCYVKLHNSPHYSLNWSYNFNNKEVIYKIPKEYCIQNDFYIGYNPIIETNYSDNIQFYTQRIGEFFKYLIKGYNERLDYILNWNPTVTINGKEIPFQRDFCWTLKDNQLFIESIYNRVDLGKIIFQRHSYKDRLIKGDSSIIDGKQRLNALRGFINNEFPDLQGYYYKDFSEYAVRRFGEVQITYGELKYNCSDEIILKVFLNVNFTGVQMSENHLQFVKSLL